MKGQPVFLGVLIALMLIPAMGLFASSTPLEWKEEAVRESIGFRVEWTTLYADICAFLFHQTGSEQVEMGTDGFLFFAETFPDFYARESLTEAEIDRLAEAFFCMSQTLEAKGIGLTVLVAPNKSTLYPERMPYYMVPAGGERNLPRLIARLNGLGVDALDAVALLENRKAEGLLYHPTDSHWNARGAFWIYQELRSRLMARYSVEMPDYEDAIWQAVPVQGDLVRLYRPLGLPPKADFAPALARAYTAGRPMRSLSDALIQTQSNANGLGVWVAHDSFGEALFPYLANGLGRLVFSRELPPDRESIEKEKVAHVVFEIAERNLPSLLEDDAMAKLMGAPPI